MKITADVLLKLRRIPNAIYCSEDELVQMLVDDPSLRYKKEALRIMVKEYQLQNRPKIEATKKEEEDVLLLDKGSKKKKKLENDFRYEPKLGHGLDYLGGIDGVKQQIENYVFLPIE